MRPGLIATFAAMGVVTYLTRAPLLLVLARRRLPGWLERYFAALPIALLTALALPMVLLPSGEVVAPWAPEIPGAVVVAQGGQDRAAYRQPGCPETRQPAPSVSILRGSSQAKGSGSERRQVKGERHGEPGVRGRDGPGDG